MAQAELHQKSFRFPAPRVKGASAQRAAFDFVQPGTRASKEEGVVHRSVRGPGHIHLVGEPAGMCIATSSNMQRCPVATTRPCLKVPGFAALFNGERSERDRRF
jgi:hypothetical protein